MNNYVDFVKQTTSEPSLNYGAMASRLAELEASGVNTTQLLTASLGLTAEAGEFTEVVKKILFQGKPYTEDNVFHMKRELGDICWYLAQAFMALEQHGYTLDLSCCPTRVIDIRNLIVELDTKIEVELRDQEKVQEQEE